MSVGDARCLGLGFNLSSAASPVDAALISPRAGIMSPVLIAGYLTAAPEVVLYLCPFHK